MLVKVASGDFMSAVIDSLPTDSKRNDNINRGSLWCDINEFLDVQIYVPVEG